MLINSKLFPKIFKKKQGVVDKKKFIKKTKYNDFNLEVTVLKNEIPNASTLIHLKECNC